MLSLPLPGRYAEDITVHLSRGWEAQAVLQEFYCSEPYRGECKRSGTHRHYRLPDDVRLSSKSGHILDVKILLFS